MMLGIKIEQAIAHYREPVIDIGKRTFEEDDLRRNIDRVITRMIEIFFEQETCNDFRALVLEASRDCEVKELCSN